MTAPRIALVGDRSPSVLAHERIPVILNALAAGGSEALDAYWLHSTSIGAGADLSGYDGIWVLPGSPYEHLAGVLHAVTTARTGAIPLLGTCGGFQHLLLEFAREVCGLAGVVHGELDPDAEERLLVPLACSLLGEEDSLTVVAGTLAASIMGAGPTTERYFCRYGLDRRYLSALEAGGLVVAGRDEAGEVRIVELPGHPFYLGTLFQPELSSDAAWVHPVLRAFATAVRAHAASGR